MIGRYRALAQRIRDELDDISRTQAAIGRHWDGFERVTRDQVALLNSMAINLHGFYSGLERLFELVAVEMDGGALGGGSWHTELLRQMSLDLSPSRPPVIRPATAERLDPYRKFRHVVRNVYSVVLDPVQIAPLVKGLPECWQSVRQDLEAFATFLEKIPR